MSLESRKAFEAFHTVKGQKRFGLVIDPGAASGLGGTDTKVEYDENNVHSARTMTLCLPKDLSVALTGSQSKALALSVKLLKSPA